MDAPNIAMGHTGGLGERLFQNNFNRTIKIFCSLVWGVISYGTENVSRRRLKNWKRFRRNSLNDIYVGASPERVGLRNMYREKKK